MSDNLCVICGSSVPEGRIVCPECEKGAKENIMPYVGELLEEVARGNVASNTISAVLMWILTILCIVVFVFSAIRISKDNDIYLLPSLLIAISIVLGIIFAIFAVFLTDDAIRWNVMPRAMAIQYVLDALD